MRNKLLILTVALMSNISWAATSSTVSIASAASLVPTLQQLATAYEKTCGGCKIIISKTGSTGALYKEITTNSTNYDIFISADTDHVTMLEKRRGALAGTTPTTFAIGHLALWEPAATHQVTERDLARLATTGTIAFADPAEAPYGGAAEAVLKHTHLWSSSSTHFITADNTQAAYDLVTKGQAQATLAPRSLVISQPTSQIWNVPDDYYTTLTQQAVLLPPAADKRAAIGFVTFLESDEARAIILKSGYTLPPKTK